MLFTLLKELCHQLGLSAGVHEEYGEVFSDLARNSLADTLGNFQAGVRGLQETASEQEETVPKNQ